MMRFRTAVALLVALAPPVSAAEIDSVTLRGERLDNSMSAMNERVNALLREGVERANEGGAGCDEGKLYKSLRRAIASPFIGHLIAERLNEDPGLDSRRIRFRESVYRDLGLFDAISVHWKDLSAVVRLDDHLVGVDKFGHFFVEGWQYFEIAYLDGDGIEEAVRWGERAERTYFGFLTTGVYSFADLSVNFDGMRFWLRVRGQHKDPLRKGWRFNRPYVSCGKRFWSREPHWRVRRDIDLDDYVNGAWDEAVNCVRYRHDDIADAIRARVEELEASDGRRYVCPVDAGRCVDARERYGLYAHALLHPACLRAEKPRSFWDFFW